MLCGSKRDLLGSTFETTLGIRIPKLWCGKEEDSKTNIHLLYT